MGRYNEELIKAGVMLAGEGLTGPEEGFVVDFNSAPPVVTDGPYTEAKELFNGFWILDVSSKEEAKQWAQKCPLGPGVRLEVRRVSETEEFPRTTRGSRRRSSGGPTSPRRLPAGQEGRGPLRSRRRPPAAESSGGPAGSARRICADVHRHRSVTRSSLDVMTDDLLRHPLHSGHLTVGALKRNKDKPVLFLGDTTLTGGQLADRISQYIQAFEALGAGTGPRSGCWR